MLGPSHPIPRILSRDAGWPNLPGSSTGHGLVKATLPTPLGGAVGEAAPETCETRDNAFCRYSSGPLPGLGDCLPVASGSVSREWAIAEPIKPDKEHSMPVAYLDVPLGIPAYAKQPLVQEIFAALDEAYRIPDTRIFIREWLPENVSQDGRLDGAPPRPVVSLEVAPGISVDEKRSMVKRISAAVTAAYHLSDVLIFLREYPLDMVGLDDGLQSENPVILQAMEQAAASRGMGTGSSAA
jgi:phenylpyruvate tautomerase PptA (4-oxalocrotonate tautomerase family)